MLRNLNNIIFLPKTNYALEFCSQTTAYAHDTFWALALDVDNTSLKDKGEFRPHVIFNDYHFRKQILSSMLFARVLKIIYKASMGY